MTVRAALALLAALAPLACALPRLPDRVAECPGPLADVASLPGGDYALREKLRVRGPGVDSAFELVAERRGARLVLVAFDPLGARAFSAVQEGLAVEVESKLGRLLPIAPLDVLRDLHVARLATEASEDRVSVKRPGCEHRSSFVRVERRALAPSTD